MRPKDKPVVDRDYMAFLARTVQRCEWPDGCNTFDDVWYPLQVCHIKSRGMGGGHRKDTPNNLVVLCRRHHEQFDQQMGQSRKNQDWLRTALATRTWDESAAIAQWESKQCKS